MDRLIKWLVEERGLEIIERGDDYVNCRDGNNVVHFRYIYLDIPNEADVTKGIAEVAGIRTSFNKAYIVVDKSAVNFVDGKLLRKLGIGIIVMGNEISEALASAPISTADRHAIDDEEELVKIRDVVRSLQDKLAEVERRVQELENAVREIKASDKRMEEPSSRRIDRSEARGGNEEAGHGDAAEGDVPQYMRGNPWLDILGNRGK